jgi:hypothetical protein
MKRAANGNPGADRGNVSPGDVREKRQGTHAFAESPKNRFHIHDSTIGKIPGSFKPSGGAKKFNHERHEYRERKAQFLW